MAQLAIRSRPLVRIVGPAPDRESRDWVEALSDTGPARQAAVERLHALLLRAARFEVARRQCAAGVSVDGPGELDDLAMHAANDALVAILNKLDTYRGDSRFTTWAYKFALLETAVQVRRRSWQGREVPLEGDGGGRLADRAARPDQDAECAELIAEIGAGIGQALTPHQRTVLVALTLDEVPIDVLADRLGSTRGALYKTLHDARRQLRAHLAAHGHTTNDLPQSVL
jgi:RNA polymerase sigma-70 factor, ECF subfamily